MNGINSAEEQRRLENRRIALQVAVQAAQVVATDSSLGFRNTVQDYILSNAKDYEAYLNGDQNAK